MGLGARSSFVSLVGLVTFTLAQLSPSSAAARKPAPNPPPPATPVSPSPQGYAPPPGYYPGYASPPSYYPPPPSSLYARPVRRPKGLLIAGPIVLVASYAFTALVGLQMLSNKVEMGPGTITYCTNCDTVGTRFMIPLIGPWLAVPDSDGDDGKAVAVVLGLAQATGLVLTIVGISRYAASAPDRTTAAAPSRWQLALVPGKGGGFGVLGGSF